MQSGQENVSLHIFSNRYIAPLAEGYTFGDTPSFTRHLGIAYGSAVETGELLELALDAGILSTESATVTLNGVRNTQQLLVGLLKKRRKFERSEAR